MKLLLFLSFTPSASSLANEPGWATTGSISYVPSPMITSRSISTRLPWEGSPDHSRPPSVSPSEGASTSEGPVGIQSTTTPLKDLGGDITQ